MLFAKEVQDTRLGFDIIKDDDSNQNNNLHEQKPETKKLLFIIFKDKHFTKARNWIVRLKMTTKMSLMIDILMETLPTFPICHAAYMISQFPGCM